jgi:hypothetical protein
LKVYQKGIGLEGVGWIYLACSMDKWLDVVNHQVTNNDRNFVTG